MRIAVVSCVLLALGCGGQVTGAEDLAEPDAAVARAIPDARPAGKGDQPEICGNGVDDNGNGYIDEGCFCTHGQTEACWPGDPALRHVGSCADGVMTCDAADIEFPKWSACVGAVTDCGPPRCVPAAEVCAPGTSRWCDGPQFCNWGIQTCGPDGGWGACVETDKHPDGCDGFTYSEVCCENAGGCCESVSDHLSYGHCAGVTKSCHESN